MLFLFGNQKRANDDKEDATHLHPIVFFLEKKDGHQNERNGCQRLHINRIHQGCVVMSIKLEYENR